MVSDAEFLLLLDDDGNPYLVSGTFDSSITNAPTDGLFVAVKDVNFSALGNAYFGFFDGTPTALAQIEHAFKSNAAGWRLSENGADLAPNFTTIATGTDYDIVAVYDADLKVHYFLRSASNDFRRIWRSRFATSASTVYGEKFNSGATFTNSTERFGLLGTELLTPDIDIASPSVGALPDLPSADFVAQFTITLPSSGSLFLHFRQQAINDYWRLECSSTGNLRLFEVVSGSATSRANAAGVLTTGMTVTLVVRDTTIAGFYNNTLGWSYSSAGLFDTEVGFELSTVGTGGAISDLEVWESYPTGDLATKLAEVTA